MGSIGMGGMPPAPKARAARQTKGAERTCGGKGGHGEGKQTRPRGTFAATWTAIGWESEAANSTIGKRKSRRTEKVKTVTNGSVTVSDRYCRLLGSWGVEVMHILMNIPTVPQAPQAMPS